MSIKIDNTMPENKKELIEFFRNRGNESLQLVQGKYSENEFKRRASAINKEIITTKELVVKNILQKAKNENWDNNTILNCILITTYASYIAMLEYRNAVWEYEYMAFSRRIGELWEPFCKLCFEYPLNDITLFIPPLFSEVRKKMNEEIEEYIDKLSLNAEQKSELKKYYNKVWSLVTSGEIKLELDCHFNLNEKRYNIDFKSGFGSNEKGNTNRLLLVATIYKNMEENYNCILLVRSQEYLNNHYFQTLKKSGIWEAYCGQNTYRKIKEFTGFDLTGWISDNIDWKNDISEELLDHLINNELNQYLIW